MADERVKTGVAAGDFPFPISEGPDAFSELVSRSGLKIVVKPSD